MMKDNREYKEGMIYKPCSFFIGSGEDEYFNNFLNCEIVPNVFANLTHNTDIIWYGFGKVGIQYDANDKLYDIYYSTLAKLNNTTLSWYCRKMHSSNSSLGDSSYEQFNKANNVYYWLAIG